MEGFYEELIKKLKKKEFTEKKLSKLKRNLSQKYKLEKIPTNIEILLHADSKDLRLLKKKLLTKPTRTISGVAPIAIMTKPFPCPHAKTVGPCIMCPGGPKSEFGDVPQSYTGKEPATMRGIRNKYDAYFQVFNRLEQYVLLGHNFQKVELIVMGGTFPSFPLRYQEEFVWGAFKAMNDFSKLFCKAGFDFVRFKKFFELPVEDLSDKKRIARIQQKLRKLKGKYKQGEFVKEQKRNEKSAVKGIALCIETRPDYCFEEHIQQMLRLGCTRVELGVQHLDNEVLTRIRRGHTVEDTIKATKLLKDSYLKCGYHMMPGLPSSSVLKDKKMLVSLFENPAYRPDALKIYPCMVTKGTRLFKLYKEGKYNPLTTKKAAEMIAWFKERIPEYVRVLRVQRDIPTYQTVAGVDMTNLRQYIHQKFKPKCRCIRCREPKGEKIDFSRVEIKVDVYEASLGTEFFISAEAEDKLLGFCRLRIHDDLAGVRELHVYGTATALGEEGSVQHKGLGKRLLKKAESIVKENRIDKLKVISGIGVRQYYARQDYRRDGYYMVKKFK